MPNYISEINGNPIRKGSYESSQSASESGFERTQNFSIVIVADSFDTTENELLTLTPPLNGFPVPRLYDLLNGNLIYEIRFSRTITKHRVTGDDTYAWTLEYSSSLTVDLNNAPREEDGTLDQSGNPGNPLFLPAEFDIGAEIEYIPADLPIEDADGNRIVNRFGQPLGHHVKGLELERAVNVIRITRWGNWPTPILQLNLYNNTVNATDFHGIPRGCAWLNVKSRKAWYEGVEYARETYTIRVLIDPEDSTREDTWGTIEIPHTASYYLARANEEDSRQAYSIWGGLGPFQLKADGTEALNEADVEMLEFSPRRHEDWTPLNLPNR